MDAMVGFLSALKDANIDTVSIYWFCSAEELAIETTEELTSIICASLFCTALTKAELLSTLAFRPTKGLADPGTLVEFIP